MKAAYCNINDDSTNCAKLLGTATMTHHCGLISDNTSLISNINCDGGLDTCTFYSDPTDEMIMAFGENFGDTVYVGSGESSGSIAFSGGESCGSIASAGGMSSSASSGCGCCYSC